jgi:hypothetical protein
MFSRCGRWLEYLIPDKAASSSAAHWFVKTAADNIHFIHIVYSDLKMHITTSLT